MLTAPGQWQWIEEELPALGPNDILVRTIAGAISVGSEVPYYRGTARSFETIRYPRMTGYESIGIVETCGNDVHTIHKDAHVVAFYGHRTYAIVAEHKVIPIPDDISNPLAILTILSCDVAKGVRKLKPMPEEAVLITGAGAIGLLTLFVLQAYGCSAVDVIEPCEERRKQASKFGARTVFSPDNMDSTNKKYTVAFECSSRDTAFHLVQQHMQASGRICILADGNSEPLTLVPAFHAKELQIIGSSDGWDYHQHAAWYFDYVRKNQRDLEQLFELHITDKELKGTFNQLAKGEIAPIKILVKYNS